LPNLEASKLRNIIYKCGTARYFSIFSIIFIYIVLLAINMNNLEIVLITPNDEPIGIIDKISAHKYAMLHRAFSVFIYRIRNGNIELLLQQRQLDKYHCGGLWTNTCCSHPPPHQDILTSAKKRLQYEMGISADLELIGRFHYVAILDNGFFENELDYVLVGSCYDQEIPFNEEEVHAIKWISMEELHLELTQSPELFTPWFGKALQVLIDSDYNKSKDF